MAKSDKAAAPERTPSRHELYLNSLAEANANGNQPEVPEAQVEKEVPSPYAVEDQDTSAFVGVSPEYRTYSGEFKKPYQAEEGPTVDAEQEAADRQLPLQLPNVTPPPNFENSEPYPGAAQNREEAGVKPGAESDAETSEDTPQLPPVPPSGGRGRRAAHSDDSTDDEN